MKLFCLPYAAGSAQIYSTWKNHISSRIEIIPIELSGRGRRIQEPLYETFDDAIADVFQLICDQIKSSDYALLGHSMGAKIAFEIAHKLREDKIQMPKHIFYLGRGAPYVPGKNEKMSGLPDLEFKEKVLQLGGTPKEFFEHPELMELFLPLIKNDFRLSEFEREEKWDTPLNCSFTIGVGKNEDLYPEQIVGWKDFTSQSCSIHFFDGDHFFIHNNVLPITRLVNLTLLDKNQ